MEKLEAHHDTDPLECTVGFILLPLTGCWSNKEIEDLALIVGTSMDLENREVLGKSQRDKQAVSLTGIELR